MSALSRSPSGNVIKLREFVSRKAAKIRKDAKKDIPLRLCASWRLCVKQTLRNLNLQRPRLRVQVNVFHFQISKSSDFQIKRSNFVIKLLIMASIADIRTDYKRESLSEKDISNDPYVFFNKWWDEAVNARIDEVNAMTLATASADGVPSARIVLLKDHDEKGFTFFSNYNSYKGRQLEENPRACLVFFWKELERQVRITGLIEKLDAKESDEYFHSRPDGSRIGAWASPQSEVIESREWLEENERKFKELFGNKPIQRPDHWGGYRVKPVTIEFWQGRPNRLHDRFQFTLKDEGGWLVERLAP